MLKKFLLIIFLLIMLLPFSAEAKVAFVAASSLTGGGAGAVDAIECDDIVGDNSMRAIATSDVCLVMTSAKDFYVYVYDAAGVDSEISPDIIVPDDRINCTTGQWNLLDSMNVARTADPQSTYRDLDCTDSDDNVYTKINCTDTGSGTEDCDYEVYVQIAGVPTKVLQVDADGNFEIALDADLAAGKVYKINGTQISLDNITDSATYQRVLATDIDASNHVNILQDQDGTGAAQITGPTATRIKTVRDAADIILELGGSYTIGSGYWDFAAANYLKIPNGANPTVDSAGKFALDTSAGAGSGIRLFTDIAATIPVYQVLPPIVIKDPTAGSDYPVFKAPANCTVRAVHYLCVGGTNWVGQLQEADANGGSGADTQAADSTAATGTTTNVTSFSNASIDSGDWVTIKTTSISGSPTSITVQAEITYDQVN
jgi:hypothetical protein